VGAIRKRKTMKVKDDSENLNLWISVCVAVCSQIGATMLSVSTDSFSCVLPNQKVVSITDEDIWRAMATGDYKNALLEMKS